MEIIQNLLTKNRFSRPGTKLKNPTAIAWHYVGNPGSSALGNRNYFENLKNQKTETINGVEYLIGTKKKPTFASSNYIIGLKGEIIQCVPDDEIAYATGPANSYSISIECCHPDTTGKYTEATYKSMLWLGRYLMNKYGITKNIRHYDVTGKICPKWFVDHPGDWNKLIKELEEGKMLQKLIDKYGEDKVEKALVKLIESVNDDGLPADWAKKELQEAVDLKITDGKNPEMFATRQEAAIMIKRAIKK